MQTVPSSNMPTSPYLAAIPKVVHRIDFQRVVLGDIYLSRDELIYIYYGGFKSSSAVAGGAAALLGGVVGVLAVAWTDGSVGDALPYYRQSLLESWGMSPERRATMWPSITIRRDDVKKWEATGGIAFETAGGEKYVFGYTKGTSQDEVRELLSEWLDGTLQLRDSVRTSGIDPIAKAPYDLIEEAKCGTLPSPEEYPTLVAREDYAKHLIDLFSVQKYAVKVRSLPLFANGPKEWRKLLEDKLESSGGKQKPRPPLIPALALLVGLYMIGKMIYMLWVIGDSKGHDLFFMVSLLIMPFVCLVGVVRIVVWRIRCRDRALLALLRG